MAKLDDVMGISKEKSNNTKNKAHGQKRRTWLSVDVENQPSTQESIRNDVKNFLNSDANQILELKPNDIKRWKYKDRPENELGDLNELANTFKEIGQQQPCVVRKDPYDPKAYELIIGERRWHAARIAGINLKVVICDVNDKQAALMQAVENESRNNLSDYAKGLSYADKIEQGILKQSDLTDLLGISRLEVSRLLSFSKLPKELLNAINDMRSVSSRTSAEMVRLITKDRSNLPLLIEVADKIRTGKFGTHKIEIYLAKAKQKHSKITENNTKITSNDGRHLFTWRLDNNASPSVHFPKDIVKLINNGSIHIDTLSDGIKKAILKELSNLQVSAGKTENMKE